MVLPSITAPISRKRKQSRFPVLEIGLAILIALSILAFIIYQMRESTLQLHADDHHQEQVQQLIRKVSPSRVPINVSVKQTSATDDSYGGTVVVKTEFGDIRIVLRPDLSEESCRHIHQVIESQNCSPCNIYRSDSPGILQGIIKSKQVTSKPALGKCPPEYADSTQDCPEWDKKCACHGPIMERGMVGWAGGGAGPDFFIDTYKNPAKWWGQQHTVFGEVRDDSSFGVIETIYAQPIHKNGIMKMLEKSIHFELELER